MVLDKTAAPAFLAALLPVLPAAGGEQQEKLSLELRASLLQALIESSYCVTQEVGTCAWTASNSAQAMFSTFSAEGVRIAGESRVLGAWGLSLSLQAWGRGGSLQRLQEAEPTAEGRRVEYRRGPITEWYVNEERGLEQGFTVDTPPAGLQDEGPLWLVLSTRGGLSAEVLPSGRDALFTDPEGDAVLRYTGLGAWDANGRELEASLAFDDGRLSIRVEDGGAVYPVHIDPCIANEEAKLTASDAAAGDFFGNSVAVSGDTALVGAHSDDHPGAVHAGSAYVFVRSGTTWSEQQKLTASDAAASDAFGSSVALSGETAVIGASSDTHAGGTDAGSAYVFVRSATTWSEQQKLTASDAAFSDSFGISVAVSGDTAVIGASSDTHAGGVAAGSAYVFVRSGTSWSEQQKLTASDAAASDGFGTSVALSGDTAVVGAWTDDHSGGTDAGSAYVFVRSGTTWSEQQKLTASDAADFDGFGISASLSGDTAVFGACSDDHAGGADAGSAYVFVRSATTWSEQQKLTASDAASGDLLGCSVTLTGDTAVVGAFLDDHAGVMNAGSAYVFVSSGASWGEQQKLVASDPAANDDFGISVGASGEAAVVGAYNDDHAGGLEAGSAYAFDLSASPSYSTYCTAGISASGCQAALSASGVASASAASGFDLMASTVEGAKSGGFFFGTSGKQANPWGNGTSFICVAPPLTRLRTLPGSGTQGACDGSFAQDLNAIWCPSCPSPSKNPGPGVLVQAQLWYRDPRTTSNQASSLSDAIEFCVGP